MSLLLRTCLPAFALLVLACSPADAQRQGRVGKPCGNTCIARDKVCRVGPGTAVQAPGSATPRARGASPSVPSAAAPASDSPLLSPARGIPQRTIACTVARVVDGDTVNCTDGRRVRLLLIDAPEMGQGPFGRSAREALGRLLPLGTTTQLELDVERADRYRRTLAYVWLPDGRMANEELARQGFVVVSVYPPNVRHVDVIRAAVQDAQGARRGLWSTSAFECTPQEHRRGRCD